VIALEAGCLPIVPVVCSNFSHIFHFPSRHFGVGTIKVRVLRPVEWDIAKGEANDHAVRRIMERVRDSMIQSLQEISG
jgi:1-acyl-sn-glycerol-3-phosphate acyltransferase